MKNRFSLTVLVLYVEEKSPEFGAFIYDWFLSGGWIFITIFLAGEWNWKCFEVMEGITQLFHLHLRVTYHH